MTEIECLTLSIKALAGVVMAQLGEQNTPAQLALKAAVLDETAAGSPDPAVLHAMAEICRQAIPAARGFADGVDRRREVIAATAEAALVTTKQ